MNDWVRLWHDMPTDPKWRVIARKSGQPLPCVIAVFNLLMVSASQNSEQRGVLLGWNDEDAAAALDMDPEAITAILDAMQGKVLDGNRLTGWDRRQPKREDNSADRVRAYRERQRTSGNAAERDETQDAKVKRNVTQRNAPDEDTDADADAEKKHDYAFCGRVIRLSRPDGRRWEKAYPDLDIPALLQSRDDWLADRPEPERKRWFNSTSNWLAAKQSQAKSDRVKGDAHAYPVC